ncbi:MAG TPA: PrsW family glutamic-type intramembrane protease [Candidatus Aminicenantes bacterium]|nr:PrsW family glutamic-type intramembrane protease [Candidatus Aminicenantes bacterium]
MLLRTALVQFVLLILAPAIFWVWYSYYSQRRHRQPLVLTAFAFLLGFVAAWGCVKAYLALPAIGVPANPSRLLSRPAAFLLYSVLVTGVLEETAKSLPFLFMTRFRDFGFPGDGIFFASVVALGFASYENIGYVTTLTGFELVGRAIASPLTHSVFASIWGVAFERALIARTRPVPALIRGVLLAALAHGAFNFLNLAPPLRILSAVIILALWLWRIGLTKRAAP